MLIILLASTFHPYILLFLLMPFLCYKPWSAGTWVLLTATIVAGLTLPSIIGTIVNTAALLGDGYNAEEFIGEGVNTFRVLVASVPALLTLVFRHRIVEKSKDSECLFFNCSFVYACILFVGLFGTANYFGRLANYFVLFPAIALPTIMEDLPDRDRHFLTELMVVCYLAFFYYGNAISESFESEFTRITIWKYFAS